MGKDYDKYGNIKKTQTYNRTIDCNCSKYSLRHYSKDKYCWKHTNFDTEFYLGNIEERPYFNTLVKDLDCFNRLNNFIRASLYYAYNLDENGFYHNTQELCEACLLIHREISRKKIHRLINYIGRYCMVITKPKTDTILETDNTDNYSDHETSDESDCEECTRPALQYNKLKKLLKIDMTDRKIDKKSLKIRVAIDRWLFDYL